MFRSRWYSHPLFVFISSLVALGVSLYVYINSYLKVNEAFTKFVKNHNLPASRFLQGETWVTILTLSILVALILFGMALIFIYYQRVIMLYRQQQNFINGFTHELKTPIASIKIFLDTFKMHELPRQEQLKYLDLMIKDTQRLSENVNQILNLGKLEERNFQADLETIHPHQLIYSIVEKDEAFSQRMELTFDNKLADDVLVKIDFSLMEILVRNFLSNALNYSNKERPSVVITFRMDDKKQVVVDFCDDGIGIPPAEQKKIFRKFYQVGKSVKGSGLGLYMVSQIAKFHKGRVKVFSKGLGEGSQFTLILPQALESSHE